MGNMSSLYYMVRHWSNPSASTESNPLTSSSLSSSSSSVPATAAYRQTNRYDIDHEERCNYMCPVCKKSGKMPTISGRFYIINDTECQCNACYTIFHKNMFYQKYRENLGDLEDGSFPSNNKASTLVNESNPPPIRGSLDNGPYRFYGYNRIRNFITRRNSDTSYHYPTAHHTVDSMYIPKSPAVSQEAMSLHTDEKSVEDHTEIDMNIEMHTQSNTSRTTSTTNVSDLVV